MKIDAQLLEEEEKKEEEKDGEKDNTNPLSLFNTFSLFL